MYYASIGILALLVLIINNYFILRTSAKKGANQAHLAYRNFLFSVIAYYITDVLWEGLYALKLTHAVFIETTIYFISMAISVFLWSKYVIAYLNVKKRFTTVLKYAGYMFLIIQIAVLAVNFFIPIAFSFDSNCLYRTGYARTLNMMTQFILFATTTIYMITYTFKLKGRIKKRYRTIWTSSFTLSIFVIMQIRYPLMPFYAIGFMLATCLIHAFIQEDEKNYRCEELERLLQIEEIQEQELGSARHMAYTDPLTGVKNKNAYIEDVAGIECRRENGILKNFSIIVFDVNELKEVNDTKGHEEGDLFIKEACNIICQKFKHSPIYRIGGDEFVAFLLGDDFKNREKLLEEFEITIDKNKAEGKVVIASGLADLNKETGETFLRLFERADRKMYERKKELKDI